MVHNGPPEEVLLLTGVLIGLKKLHPQSKVLWVGDPQYFPIIRFNKRIRKILNIHKGNDLASLTHFYGSDICYNPSDSETACRFASITGSKQYFGFNKDGAVDKNAEFFQKITSGKLKTNKTILDMYYGLAGIKWRGEGYGLSYYPTIKQTKQVGICAEQINEPGEIFKASNDYLETFDIINQYKKIITDKLFVAHAALALRKKVVFRGSIPYKLNFNCDYIL